MLIAFFSLFLSFSPWKNINMINSASDTYILRTWLVNHTLHLSITFHHVCVNNSVAPDYSQMLPRTIFFHIINIHFRFHIISKYFVVNSLFSVNFIILLWLIPLCKGCVASTRCLIRFLMTVSSLIVFFLLLVTFSSSLCCWKSRMSSWFVDSNSGIYSWTRNYLLVSKILSMNIIILAL